MVTGPNIGSVYLPCIQKLVPYKIAATRPKKIDTLFWLVIFTSAPVWMLVSKTPITQIRIPTNWLKTITSPLAQASAVVNTPYEVISGAITAVFPSANALERARAPATVHTAAASPSPQITEDADSDLTK